MHVNFKENSNHVRYGIQFVNSLPPQAPEMQLHNMYLGNLGKGVS